jgi:hypothetical protein
VCLTDHQYPGASFPAVAISVLPFALNASAAPNALYTPVKADGNKRCNSVHVLPLRR